MFPLIISYAPLKTNGWPLKEILEPGRLLPPGSPVPGAQWAHLAQGSTRTAWPWWWTASWVYDSHRTKKNQLQIFGWWIFWEENKSCFFPTRMFKHLLLVILPLCRKNLPAVEANNKKRQLIPNEQMSDRIQPYPKGPVAVPAFVTLIIQ